MLHPSVTGSPSHLWQDQQVGIYAGPELEMAPEWTMQPRAMSMVHRGLHVTPAKKLKFFELKNPNLYRYSISIANPSMMFMIPNAVSLDQMIWADVLAWQLL